jgi:hypothetical protein
MPYPVGMTTTARSDPTQLIPDAVERCLDLAGSWLAWDGRPRVSEPTGRTVTLAADWAPFTEADLNEAGNRLRRLGQVYALRLRGVDAEALDAPRGPACTIRQIVEHVAGVT